MKKLMSVFLVLLMLFIFFIPNTSYAATNTSVSDLVTGVYQSGENKITFKINGKKYSNIRYEINLCSSQSSSTYFPIKGKLIIFGACNANQTITVAVPVMGKYVITSYSNKGNDIDYVNINYVKIVLSNKFKWTVANMVAQKAALLAADIVIGVALTAVGCPGCGIAYAITSGGAKIAVEVTATNRNIDIVPIKNYSWQYKYVPNSSGYKVYLLVYDTKDNLVNTYYINTITFK